MSHARSQCVFRSCVTSSFLTLDLQLEETMESIKRRLNVGRSWHPVLCCLGRLNTDVFASVIQRVGTPRQAKDLVFEGRVLMDSETVTSSGILLGSGTEICRVHCVPGPMTT